MSANQAASPVWLITGSSAGLGLALTRHVLAQGHRVIATSRQPSTNANLVAEVEGQGGHWLRFDARQSEDDVRATVQQAHSFFGRIDVLVNNAGYCVLGALEDTPDAEVEAQLLTNFVGPLRLMRVVLPGMRRRRHGVIVNVSSTQGFCPSHGCSAYAASKAALEAVTEACGAEVAPFGIRTLIIEPGAFKTSFAAAGAATYIAPSQEYAGDHIVGQRLHTLQGLPERARGDPAKAAAVIFEAVTGDGEAGRMIKDEKLLRVIVGPDSWKAIDQKVTALRHSTDLLADVAASTNF